MVARFELLGELGRGAFGTVYRARDPQLDREVALKVARCDSGGDKQEMLQRFLREAQAAAQLHHPNIVPIFDAGCDQGTYFIAAGLVLGPTLRERCDRGTPLTFREAAQFVATLANALDYAHRQGVVHRDIKPTNILLGADGSPQIADFGLAHRDQADDLLRTRDGAQIGTPAYMSPEQASGHSHDVDGRSDVWSVGVILYELLTRQRPFRGSSVGHVLQSIIESEPLRPRTMDRSIPRDLETICLKCLEKHRDARYATAADLAEDLQRWLEDEPIIARPLGPAERAGRWINRNRLLTALIVVLFTGIGFSSFFAWQWRVQLTAARLATVTIVEQRDAIEKSLSARNEAYADLAEQAAANDLREGIAACQNGRVDHGLLYLARAFTTLPSHAEPLRFTILANLKAWSHQLNPLLWQVNSELPVTSPGWLRYTPDGEIIAITSFDRDQIIAKTGAGYRTCFFDPLTGKECRSAVTHTSRILAATFRPGTHRMVTVEAGGYGKRDAGGVIREWDIDQQCETRVPIRCGAALQSAVISPDGLRVAAVKSVPTDRAGRYRQFVQVWELETGKSGPEFFQSANLLNSPLHFMDDGNFVAALASSDWNRHSLIWDIERQTETPLEVTRNETLHLMTAEAGKYALTRAGLWDISKLPAGSFLPSEWSDEWMSNIPPTVLSDARGCGLIALRRHGEVSFGRIWNCQAPCQWVGQPLVGEFVEISPTGRTAVTASEATIRLWSLASRAKKIDSGYPLDRYLQSADQSLVAAYFEVATGMTLTSTNDFRLLDFSDWQQRRSRLDNSE